MDLDLDLDAVHDFVQVGSAWRDYVCRYCNKRWNDESDYDATCPGHPPAIPRCIACDVELSSTLDAYYGTSARLAKMCRPCRDDATDEIVMGG